MRNYNPYAISTEEFLGDGARPLPYTVQYARHGEIFTRTIYDVSGEAAAQRIVDALERGQGLDAVADAWHRGVDACAIYAGDTPHKENLLQAWWRADTPQCRRGFALLDAACAAEATPII